MLSSFVRNVRLTLRSAITFQQVSIISIAILIILCKLDHWNNSNDISLFIALYLYLTGVKINLIIFFNYISLFVLHNMLLKILHKISKSSVACIKAYTSNCRLIRLWDNFNY